MTSYEQTEELQELAKNIGVTLRKNREKLGVSQRQFAKDIGVKQPVISRLENGTHVPTLYNLNRIAKALGLSMTVSFKVPK